MSYYFPDQGDCGYHTIFPGVNIRTTAADKMLIAVVDLEPHSIVPEHSHHHEQIGLLVSGKAHFFIGDENRILQEGALYRIPSNVRHKVVVLDQPTRAIDIFCPVREEYR